MIIIIIMTIIMFNSVISFKHDYDIYNLVLIQRAGVKLCLEIVCVDAKRHGTDQSPVISFAADLPNPFGCHHIVDVHRTDLCD